MQGLHRVISTFKVSAQMPIVAFSLQHIHNAGDFNSFIMHSPSRQREPCRNNRKPSYRDVRNGYTRRFDTMPDYHNRNHLVLY